MVVRCPASNDCTGISQAEYRSERSPENSFPQDLENSGRSVLARASNITMRAEPDTPAQCCAGNNNLLTVLSLKLKRAAFEKLSGWSWVWVVVH